MNFLPKTFTVPAAATIVCGIMLMAFGSVEAVPYVAKIKEGEDTFILGAKQTVTPGAYSLTMAGRSPYSTRGRVKTFIRFDLSSVKGNVASISGARLKLFLAAFDGQATATDTVKVYRVTSANKDWSGGSGTTAIDSVKGGACWAYKAWDPTLYWPGSPNAGKPMHQAWVGGANAIYETTPVASAVLTSTQRSTMITITFSDVTFFKSWSDSGAKNPGFVIDVPQVDATTLNDCVSFASFEYATLDVRPVLELDCDWTGSVPQTINYTLATAGNVSMLIRNDSLGMVVKERLFAAPLSAGANQTDWDCKNMYGEVVPNGTYTIKMLQTQGLQAEYLLDLGITATKAEKWPGNSGCLYGVAVVDTTGVFVGGGAGFGGEGTIKGLKMRPNGQRLATYELVNNSEVTLRSCYVDSGTVYYLPNGSNTVGILKNPEANTVSHSTYNVGSVQPFDLCVRNGIMAVLYRTSLEWRTTANVLLGTVSITNGRGVTIDNTGRALVISGSSVLAYTRGNATPTTLISSGLVSPYRLDVNHANGDIYIAEAFGNYELIGYPPDGPKGDYTKYGQQVKVFSASGTLLNTFGKVNGRPIEGAYNPNDGFLEVYDIAVCPDGSFWILEGNNNIPPRRVAHYDKTGHVIKEFFGGTMYANHAAADPDDPTIMWMTNNWGDFLVRTKVDYITKTWKPLGSYRYNNTNGGLQVIPSYSHENHIWQVRKHNGQTYLIGESKFAVCYFDTTIDRLVPVSVAHQECACWPANEYIDTIIRNNRPNGAKMYSTWYDANGDRKFTLNEMTSSFNDTTNSWFGGGCHLGKDFSFTVATFPDSKLFDTIPSGATTSSRTARYGLATIAPQWQTINGVAMPVYNWDQFSWVSAVTRTAPRRDFSTKALIPGKDMKYLSGGSTAEDNEQSFFAEYSGDDYYFNHDLDTASRLTTEAKRGFAERFVTKWDKNGVNQWAVGSKSNGSGKPVAGSITRFDHILGTANGCLQVADFNPWQYCWDSDGLWVGYLLDNPIASQKTLPSYTWQVCNEQFAGSTYEVKNNNTPGLNKGDVLFIGAGQNDNPIYRITGWDRFQKFETSVVVKDGRIISQGSVSANTASSVRAQTLSLAVARSSRGLIVTWTLPVDGPVRCEIFSMLGQRVEILQNGMSKAGTHSVTVNEKSASNMSMSNGLYVVRLSAGNQRVAKPIAMVR